MSFPTDPLLTVSMLLDDPLFFVALISIFIIFAEGRWEKRKKILVALFVAYILSVGAKALIHKDRPCVTIEGKIECPVDSSFPSGHAAFAFTLMIAFLGKRSFPFFWLFAIFVVFSRIYLGIHTFEDVAGGLVVAPLAYYITDSLWGAFGERNK